MGRPRKNEDEQRPQRVMAKRHTKTPARFLNILSDSDMMFLDPVPTLGSHKLSTGTGSSDLIGPAQSLEAPLLNYTKAQSVKPFDASSPTNILCVLSQLGIVEKSAVLDVRRLPSIDDRKNARTKADITGKAFATLERVFSRIVTGVLKMLLPAWHVPDKMWKQMIHIPIEKATEDIDDEGTVIPPITADASKQLYDVATSIALSVVQCGASTSIDARSLLAQLKDLPLEYVQEVLAKVGGKSSKATMKRIMFQAKVDDEYFHRGLQLVPYFQTHQRMKDEVVKLAVETVYSWNNVSRLAWLVKRGPATSCKWKDLENICAMKSLVLKRDVSEMYKEYAENHKIRFPDLPHMKESLFCEIARHITGGGKKLSARAGVEYIKVNFHTDNFELVDKVIDMIASASDSDQMLRSQLLLQRSTVFSFLSYTYLLHVHEGVIHQYESKGSCQQHQCHQISDEERNVFQLYQTVSNLADDPNLFQDIKSQLITSVKAQMDMCALISGQISNTERSTVTTHSPEYTLDLVEYHAPCTDSATDVCGLLECEACQCSFLFYDQLRQSALMRFSDDSKQDVLADILLTIHQCERRTYRYMAHVVQDVQQQYLMKKARHGMSADTVYIVFDFKQKFWSRGFREVADDTEGVTNVQMEGKEQEFESTNEVSYSSVNLSAVTDNECSKEDAVNDHESDTTLHFVDCIVQDDEKSGSFVALSCLEAGLHALHRRFPHLKQVILQSDKAKNLSGKDMKMFVHQAVSSTGMELLAYHHNEAAAGKDVCDTHFAHQQARVDAYISEGDGGRKVSTAKQLAVALSTKSVKNTIVLLVKPKQEKKRKYSAAVEDRRASFTPFVVSVDGVLGHDAQHLMKRLCDQIAVKWEKSHSEVMGWVRARMAFAILRATNLCLRGSRARIQPKQDAPFRSTNVAAIQGIMNYYSIEYNSEKQKVMFYRNLGQSVPSVCRKMVTASLSSNDEDPFGNSGKNFSGSTVMLHNLGSKKLTTRVEEFIAKCWQEGESKIVNGKKEKSHLKVSAEAVQSRLVVQYEEGQLRLSEVPVIGQVRLVYQRIGQNENDLVDVLEEVSDVATDWNGLGLKLGLRPSTLEEIEEIGSTQPQHLLKKTLTAWLRQNYNVKRYGLPSWATLCKAVKSRVGGNNRALACKIAKKHNIRI
eukprot:Em0002g417a